MAGVKINITGSTGELASDSFGNAKVNHPLTGSQAGFSSLLTERDPGAVTGTRDVYPVDADTDFRLRTGTDVVDFAEQFPGSAINTALWGQQTSGMTIVVGGNFCTLNSNAVLTSTAYASINSYQFFALYGSFPTYMQMQVQFAQAPAASVVVELGFGLTTTNAAPTDGVFFRINAAGELRGVINWGGTESQTAPIDFTTYVGVNTSRQFVIEITAEWVYFWIADVLVGKLAVPSAQGSPTSSPTHRILARIYHTATPASAQVVRIGNVEVSHSSVAKPYNHMKCLAGGTSLQGQTGTTMGSTALFANSANPTAAVPTNTTAALATGLGGLFFETDTLAVTTDGIVQSYQNPTPSATVPGKNLVITGVKIQSFVSTALTGGGYNAIWSLAFGHTAVSLATTEASGSKAPRRLPLGIQTVASGAVATAKLEDIVVDLSQAPIVVYPGEFIQAVKRKVGTAPSAGVITHVITYVGYWE